jgi:hypothetical protein
MGYFAILGDVRLGAQSSWYKGLMRHTPYIDDESNSMNARELWLKYVNTLGDAFGHTLDGISLEELHTLADYYSTGGKSYEVVYFSDMPTCPVESTYYGMDVAGKGGYSQIGMGFFCGSEHPACETPEISRSMNDYFSGQLNEYGLFISETIAKRLVGVLNEWERLVPGDFEQEKWNVYHVFGVTAPH